MSSRWDDLLARTDEMLVAARAGRFEEVGLIELERRLLLDALPAVDEATRPLLKEIALRDRALVALVEAARDDAADRLRSARQLQAGAGAYLGIALGR